MPFKQSFVPPMFLPSREECLKVILLVYESTGPGAPASALSDALQAVDHLIDACPRDQLERLLDTAPRCACCGTTENLHRNLGSGGSYRCASPDCMVF